MQDAGGEKVEIDFTPFLTAARLLYEGPWVFERYAAVGEFIETHPDSVLPVIRSIITPERTPHPSEVFRAMYRLQECRAGGGCAVCGGGSDFSRRPPEPSTGSTRSKPIRSGSTAISDTTPII